MVLRRLTDTRSVVQSLIGFACEGLVTFGSQPCLIGDRYCDVDYIMPILWALLMDISIERLLEL